MGVHPLYHVTDLTITVSTNTHASGTVTYSDDETLNWKSRRRADGTWSTALLSPHFDIPILSPPRAFTLARKLRAEGVFKKGRA